MKRIYIIALGINVKDARSKENVKKNKREVIPLNEELTPKQEKFIQNIVSGMSQREAYKNSYNAENMKDETIDAEACKLFNDHKVATRYRELMDKLEDEAIMTAKQRMIWLSEVVKGIQKEETKYFDDGECVIYEKTADLNTKIKAVDTLNKMSGEYTTKIEGNIGVTKLEDLL